MLLFLAQISRHSLSNAQTLESLACKEEASHLKDVISGQLRNPRRGKSLRMHSFAHEQPSQLWLISQSSIVQKKKKLLTTTTQKNWHIHNFSTNSCVKHLVNFSTWGKYAIEHQTPYFDTSLSIHYYCNYSSGPAWSQFIWKLSSLLLVNGCPQPPALYIWAKSSRFGEKQMLL